MTKKIVLDPNDFEKIVAYIQRMAVPFNSVYAAVEVNEALKKAQLMDITVKEEKAVVK